MSKKEDLKRDNPQFPNEVLKLTLPLPPTQNHAYINKRVGRRWQRVLNSDAQRYQAEIKFMAIDEVANQQWHMEENDTWYKLHMWFYFPDLKKRDNHNLLKIPLDALEGVIYKNDYFVLPRTELVLLDRENPRWEIIFEKLDKDANMK